MSPTGPADSAAARAPEADAASYQLSRWIFLRGLAVVHAVAFASLAVQITGLVGAEGILPVAELLEGAWAGAGPAALHRLPTLCWLSDGDAMLLGLAWGGVGLSLALAVGLAPVPCLAGLWLAYLSLQVAGQVFLGFQWDLLLLETTLLALFYAPGGWRPRLASEHRAPALARWLLWGLLFKLLFLSGITKLLSGDPTWAGGTALLHHYETQPLPAWTSWYAHQLPDAVHVASVGFVWLAECLAPFGFFAPARWRGLRLAACGIAVALQLGIAATGSYGFFNLLTIVLCGTLLDDRAWRRLLPRRLAPRPSPAPPAPRSPAAKRLLRAAACVWIPLSLLVSLREMAFSVPREPGEAPPLAWSEPWVAWARPLRSVNGYGLFRVMTTERPELSIEGRRRGGDWQAYRFRWKAGDPLRAPRFAAPHMPRLDWQMWFAALSPRTSSGWLLPLMARLLAGEPSVRALLAPGPPFDERPPDELRLFLWRYRFTRAEARPEAWWRREPLGPLTEPLSLETLRRGRTGSGRER